jgi:hypothetical protein
MQREFVARRCQRSRPARASMPARPNNVAASDSRFCEWPTASRLTKTAEGVAHPRGAHSASFEKLGLAERGTDVDEGTRDEGTRLPPFFDRN